MAMNQAPKLARLLVRESPGLPSLTIFDHDTGRVAGGDLKRAGRERYSHFAPLNGAKVGSRPRHAVGRPTTCSPLLTCSEETISMIRVGAARQP